MTYVDIFEVEAKGMYSPPNGNEPQILPDFWKEDLPDGTSVTRTDLPYLTNEELNSLGWKGPIKMPPGSNPGTSFFTHSYQWNSETREYDAIELSNTEKQNMVNYQVFWNLLMGTTITDLNNSVITTTGVAYNKIKNLSKESLTINVLATELISLLNDAKNGQANITRIQENLLELFQEISFTQEEIEEIEIAFTISGMYSIYILP
jgi:hypothetical protein